MDIRSFLFNDDTHLYPDAHSAGKHTVVTICAFAVGIIPYTFIDSTDIRTLATAYFLYSAPLLVDFSEMSRDTQEGKNIQCFSVVFMLTIACFAGITMMLNPILPIPKIFYTVIFILTGLFLIYQIVDAIAHYRASIPRRNAKIEPFTSQESTIGQLYVAKSTKGPLTDKKEQTNQKEGGKK